MPADGPYDICLHHVLGHSRIPRIPGIEHPCSGCIPNEYNKTCDKGPVRYEPVTIHLFTVVPRPSFLSRMGKRLKKYIK